MQTKSSPCWALSSSKYLQVQITLWEELRTHQPLLWGLDPPLAWTEQQV